MIQRWINTGCWMQARTCTCISNYMYIDECIYLCLQFKVSDVKGKAYMVFMWSILGLFKFYFMYYIFWFAAIFDFDFLFDSFIANYWASFPSYNFFSRYLLFDFIYFSVFHNNFFSSLPSTQYTCDSAIWD